MNENKDTFLSKNIQDYFIKLLTEELPTLRAKARISQEDLSKMIGTSRQTYSAIENKKKKMTWNIYLSLIMFYDYNTSTHQMLRDVGAFPDELIKSFNK